MKHWTLEQFWPYAILDARSPGLQSIVLTTESLKLLIELIYANNTVLLLLNIRATATKTVGLFTPADSWV